ncbi:endoribonuclease [Lithospermum erythrorhizon]|uniref:Endoribonuclease n=1 Tax=Lithospermum erythrorhizon TaxID=34254 RepID=A0AAV3R969_LITER
MKNNWRTCDSHHPLPPSLSSRLKSNRLKLSTQALSLGYTGVAYNHTIKGVISDLDKASITLFPLHVSPSLNSSVLFNRKLLNVPTSKPFRQYTRVTVVIANSLQGKKLREGEAFLNTYDLVAVRPLNQTTFELACQTAQVDIISIDFSYKLPFRLNKLMVQAAVKRGLYFEITYSCLILDAKARGQMIENAKLLVDWTRGKNLIISSGAPSVTELRGPYDAANLVSLLGLTMQKSKAAISKNCRSLIANAFRKKYCYKEVIKVEKLPPGEEMNFDDWLKWDPISTAEGDLTLDDMGKSFAASCKVSKAPKAIDFTSALNGIPSHGLQIKDIISTKVAVADPFAVSKDITTPGDQGLVELVCETPEQPLSFCSLPIKEPALAEGLVEPSDSNFEVSLPFDPSNFVSSERNDVDAVAIKEPENVQVLDPKNAEPRSLQALSTTASDERDALLSNEAAICCAAKTDILSSHDQCGFAGKFIPTNGFSSSSFHCDRSKLSSSVRLDLFTQSSTVGRSLAEANLDNFVELQGIEAERVTRSEEEFTLAPCNESLHDNFIGREARDTSNQTGAKRVSRNDEELLPVLCEDITGTSEDITLSYERLAVEDITGTSDLSVAILDEPHVTDLCNHIKTENDYSVAQDETVNHETITTQMHTDGHARTNNRVSDNSPLGKGGVKRKISGRILLFPFKRFISPRPLRKKARK